MSNSIRYKEIFFLLIFTGYAVVLSAQPKSEQKESNTSFSNKIVNLQFHYTYFFPGGDLSEDFGSPIHNIGFGGLLKTKHNWLIGLDGSYQFGADVKATESILYNLTNSHYVISTANGTPATISVSERGLNAFVQGGKLFTLGKVNRNSGLSVMAGAGFVSHMVNIYTGNQAVPTLTDDLKKGYDRLTMGFALTQWVGYHFQSKHRMVNFFVGLDIIEAFTKNVRGYNYDQMAYDKGMHTDLFFGPRVGWMIPIYLTTKDEDEFYYK